MIELNSNDGQHSFDQQYCQPTAVSQAKGLLNMIGQNNCFLNSAVQVLWHLDHFRNAIELFSGHYCTSATTACVFCSLSNLFSQFKNSTRNALNADQLRRALAHTFSAQRRFQLGLMDDCIECFEHILQRLHFHCVYTQVKEEECSAYHCLSHALFSMRLIERRFCTHCGKCEAKAPYNQVTQYVSTQALIEKATSYNNNQKIKLSFGSMVRLVSTQGEIRDCSVATCGSKVQLRKTLLNSPKILAIGLNYENERPSIDQIADVFKLIDTFIRLSDVFEIDAQNLTLNSGETNCDVLHLVGLVTYYGKHYSTFFYNTQLGTWLYLDDANVKEIGNCWPFVVDKCIKSSFQPLMLLYASANNLSSINTNQAPTAVYQVPSNIKSMMNNSNANNSNSSLNKRRSSASQISQLVLTNNESCGPATKSFVNNNQQQLNEDVPDSPFTKSSTASSAYFSDYYSGEQEAQYISKRTVQNIIHAQKYQTNNSTVQNPVYNHSINNQLKNSFTLSNQQQRNSSSSLSDSFSTTNDQIDDQTVLSSSNVDYNNKIYQQNVPATAATKQQPVFRKELRSADAGYDSYSLSSSDSYPSIGGSAVSTNLGSTSSGCSSSSGNNNDQRTNKSAIVSSTLRSIQEQINEHSTENLIASSQNNNSILADVQLLKLIEDDKNTQDCDKLANRLCSQSDILLLRSHEKERENDLKAAAVLSEAAAQKARAAMDVPLQNPNSHLLISAKMKHSMCVMRSAALMRRIKELEQEEKKCKNLMRLSRESLNHSKSHSLSTSHLLTSPSQRRASQERLDNVEKNKQIKSKPKTAVQLYGTLPKKHNLIKSNSTVGIVPVQQIVDKATSNITNNQIQQQNKPPVQAKPTQISPPNQIPVNLSEQVITKTKCNKSNKLNRNASTCSTSSIQSSNSNTCKDTDSGSVTDQYAEISDVICKDPKVSSKQHKIYKKLLIGSFIKRKNRSLPDLRDDNQQQQQQQTTTNNENSSNQLNNSNNNNNDKKVESIDEVDRPIVAKKISQDKISESSQKQITNSPLEKPIAKVSRKGFHPQSIYENQKIANNSSLNKFNQTVVLPKLAPKPAINLSPQVKSSVSQVDNTFNKIKNEKLELKELDLPPVNAEVVQQKSIDEVDLANLENLPPPPEHFLTDLRKEKEQISNQINENIDNELKEKKLIENRSTAVRNLATRFEQISMSKPPLPLPPSRPVNQLNCNQVNNQVNNQMNSQINLLNKKNHISNKSNTGLRIAVLGSRGAQSPTLIYKNSTPSPNDLKNRPDRPPDYDTTIKRLNLIQQQYQIIPNKSIDSNYSILSLPSSLNSSLDSPFKNGTSQNGNHVVPLQAHQIQQLKQQQYNVAAAVRNKKITKKSVSFSDEVVIVAHPEDAEEEPLPNPLLDRVLKKNNLSIS